jgi:hypothetical protein
MKSFSVMIALLVMLVSGTVFAGDSTGKVTRIMVHQAGSSGVGAVVMFTAGTMTDKAACSTQANQWAISLEGNKGKAMYAMLLAAKAQGTTVGVRGSGDCNDWSDRERPIYIWVD